MWYTWLLVLVCCALVKAEVTETPIPVATTARAPARTLDRQAAELAWKTWLQSPESGNPNAPPRRITTKSLFITPYVCPKGQRLDRNGCVQVLTVNKDEHERILLEQLNALFTSAPSGDLYDYGDEEPGPLQLSIPIGLDPQAAPLQGQEPNAQAQELQPNYVKVDKKDENKDASIEAELEILKLQSENNNTAPTKTIEEANNDIILLNTLPEKPKRDNMAVNSTESDTVTTSSEDVGQKELVFGHVNVDPVLYNLNTDNTNPEQTDTETNSETTTQSDDKVPESNTKTDETHANAKPLVGDVKPVAVSNSNDAVNANPPAVTLKKDGDQTKLSPETDYSDIGEAIKLISRYAEVTTDDNYTKDQKKFAVNDDSILGTRTRLQHRRNKPKVSETMEANTQNRPDFRDKEPSRTYPKNGVYFRYPWPGQHVGTPPPDYPFRHLQDYWPGRNRFGGVYNSHENPRRHHHSYPHNFRPHGFSYFTPESREAYPEQLKGYIHRMVQPRAAPHAARANQDLYSLLGLRHWFSSEGTSKR